MRVNKYEARILRKKKELESEGRGLFVFKNNTSGELYLPRATKSGVRKVDKMGEFQGTDYFMQMVKTGELRLMRVIQSPNEPAQGSNLLKEGHQMQDENEKLIIEQPPTITAEGESVTFMDKKGKKKKLNEQPQNQDSGDILLTESPLGGVEII